MTNQKKRLGIIGGMGSAATALLFKKIVDYTAADCDAEHIHILIDNYTQIPDRTAAILNGSDEPVRYICEAGKRLTSIGAELILIPCNTSHYFYEDIQKNIDVPVVNMIEETAAFCCDQGYETVGVLATDGTRKTKIFEKELAGKNIKVIYPSDEGQTEVMNVIYRQVKAGNEIDTRKLSGYLSEMASRGAQAFILGCTELPIAIKDGDFGFTFIDTLDVLSKVGIIKAGYKLKTE